MICRTALFCGLLAAAPLAAAELPPELWDRPRTAQAILAQPQLRVAVERLQARPAARLDLVHGTRAEARTQAEELRAWLVALAVEPARLQLRADAAVAGLRVELVE
ncbi:MAG: hypothetical protein K2W84_08635 [Burkholderiales bacterium]|nr:hypothetical protein [Burkholderiales bacterium]